MSIKAPKKPSAIPALGAKQALETLRGHYQEETKYHSQQIVAIRKITG